MVAIDVIVHYAKGFNFEVLRIDQLSQRVLVIVRDVDRYAKVPTLWSAYDRARVFEERLREDVNHWLKWDVRT